MHPDESRSFPPPVQMDASSLRLLSTVDVYLTPEDWADAAGAGRVPAVLGPQVGRVFARRPGTGPAIARWYHLTPAEALGDPWPSVAVPMCVRASGRLGSGGGEFCERALAWVSERDMRLPEAGRPAPFVASPAPVVRRAPEHVRYITDEAAPAPVARSFDWRHPAAFAGWCLLAAVALLALAEVLS